MSLKKNLQTPGITWAVFFSLGQFLLPNAWCHTVWQGKILPENEGWKSGLKGLLVQVEKHILANIFFLGNLYGEYMAKWNNIPPT